jgi:hypothetical protein
MSSDGVKPSVAKASAETQTGYRSGKPLRHPKAKAKKRVIQQNCSRRRRRYARDVTDG